MAILHFRSIERRRTARATVQVDLTVDVDLQSAEHFRFRSKSVSVSAHGGVVLLKSPLTVGQHVQVVNEYNKKKALCRIVSIRFDDCNRIEGAFEFVEGDANFWSMTFPQAGARPLRRAIPRKAANG